MNIESWMDLLLKELQIVFENRLVFVGLQGSRGRGEGRPDSDIDAVVVLDRLTRYKRLEQYPDDMELLDDVIVEIRQAIEMTGIYRDDIKGTRELFSAVLDNRLNNTMKWLTSVTLIMAVPTVISGLYGMNVNLDSMPFADSSFGFGIVCGLILAICFAAAWVLHKKHML